MSLSRALDASKACFSWRTFGSSCVTVSSLISVRSYVECTVSSRSMGYLLGFYGGREQAMSIERERTVGREQLEKLSMIVML